MKIPARTKGNQLAARTEGRAFNVCMRLYGPKSEALTGKWNPPPVVKTQALPGLGAQ